MSKKIVILNGGPRRNGNTAGLCEAFAQGAEASGYTVTRFDLHQMNIHGCIGCMKGGKDPASPCVQKDDMDKVYPAYEEADIVVFASPMYYWNFTGQLKIALDRLFAVTEAHGGYTAPRKDAVMLMAAGDNTQENWKPALDYYHAIVERLGWTNLGTVLAGEVLNVNDIKGKPSLEEARKLGASLS